MNSSSSCCVFHLCMVYKLLKVLSFSSRRKYFLVKIRVETRNKLKHITRNTLFFFFNINLFSSPSCLLLYFFPLYLFGLFQLQLPSSQKHKTFLSSKQIFYFQKKKAPNFSKFLIEKKRRKRREKEEEEGEQKKKRGRKRNRKKRVGRLGRKERNNNVLSCLERINE